MLDDATGAASLTVDGAPFGVPLPRRVIPLAELRMWLLHPGVDWHTRDRIWRYVLEQSGDGSDAVRWRLAAVFLLLPGLRVSYRDLCALLPWSDHDDVAQHMITGVLEALPRPDLRRPGRDKLGPRLVWAARKAGETHVRRELRWHLATSRHDLDNRPEPERGHDIERLLADAVAAGIITERQAQVVAAVLLDGLPHRVIAARYGVTAAAISAARRTAERRLAAAHADGLL